MVPHPTPHFTLASLLSIYTHYTHTHQIITNQSLFPLSLSHNQFTLILSQAFRRTPCVHTVPGQSIIGVNGDGGGSEMKERQRWQAEEDALLRAYVKQYGPKEWGLVGQRMGRPLHRDPKSCLERWKNYLKPGIKKGSLTPEEQSLVIDLQAKYGNKWKKIAADLPGRTAKRLGKWWEVFKEKQQKLIQKKTQNRRDFSDSDGIAAVDSPETGRYDHILDTFAEKYVQPNLFPAVNFPPPPLPPQYTAPPPIPPPCTAAPADQEPVLSLGPAGSVVPITLPVWMNPPAPPCAAAGSSPEWVSAVVRCFVEVEGEREGWFRHRKEAAWRLSRLEGRLEAEKGRRMREEAAAVEAEIRRLREEEARFVDRIESEYREELRAVRREEEKKEAVLMEAWRVSHVKLARIVDRIGNGGLTIGN